jgi:hypothetical protein
MGINIDFHRTKWIIQIDDYIGFSKTEQTMFFPKQYDPLLPHYKFGFFVDIKPLAIFDKQRISIDDVYDGYACLRLSFGISMPIGRLKYDDYFYGSMTYFTIGMGGYTKR